MEYSLKGYVGLLESLCLDNVEQVYEYVTDDIVFLDPFNRVSGAKAYVSLLKEMFEKLDGVQFSVYEFLCQEDNNVAYIYWHFSADSRATGKLEFDGMSRLTLDEEGKISSHQDFWDGLVVLQKAPILGTILRKIKNKISYQKS